MGTYCSYYIDFLESITFKEAGMRVRCSFHDELKAPMNSSMKPRYLRSRMVEEEKDELRNMDLRVDKKADAAPAKKQVAAPPKKLERKTTEDINESAEAFITKFKQQLLLQRLESIENYEQMLKRGT
ncbi:uncharacterized protein Fot_30552 [Forsythia ovata]|uniref:Uncharacterized protein n=1 Tax=Forsythia ovata TaxID=205694 RepID=A0ABD1TV19_9LAMI